MKAVGKFRFIKDRTDPVYRTGRHDDFEASTIDATRHKYEGQKMDGTLYSVDPEVWALELYPTTGKEDSSLVWNGDGFPPVGCECQYETNGYGIKKVRVECITKDGIAFTWICGGVEFIGLDCINISQAYRLSPIRSEADKKRDEAIESIKAMLMYDYGDDPRLNDAVILYDAIASGKIPHIRID